MITINLDKAKVIAHEMRRRARSVEFEPLDQRIAIAIPGDDKTAIEAQRQAIRDRDAAVQKDIDKAKSAKKLTEIVKPFL